MNYRGLEKEYLAGHISPEIDGANPSSATI
jgi:hypothetical protein